MINVSSLWHQALFNDNRAYEEYADITLTDNTELHLRNEDIWQNGFKIDDAVSSDSDLEIGAAIVNKLNLTINNIYGKFDAYDFTGAKVFAYIGLHLSDGTLEKIKKGRFIVQEATYNGELINLSCFDYMSKFDMPYVPTGVSFPSTAEQIVVNACRDAGVALGTADFPHKDTAIASKPSEESTTFREVIAWVAQICGCFARVNVDGQLELKWYEQSTLEHILDGTDGGIFDEGTPRYTSGDTANGGVFNPWETGTEYDGGAFQWTEHVHYINSVYNRTISVDDVVITGIRIKVKTESNGSNNSEISYLTGTEGYVIEISGNPFITTSNVDAIGTWLGNQLIGFKFRKASITHGSDPSIEAGDVALVWDRKGNVYPILVSHTTFTVGGSQTTISSAQTPTRNSAARFSVQTKNYVEMRERLKDERSLREQMEAQLAEDIANSNGMYYTEVTDEQTQATKYYLHNKPLLAESMIRILVSDVGITVTNDGGEHWYGLTVNGNLIANILSATGINADWIDTGSISADRISGGTLTLGGRNNIYGQIRILDASGNEIGSWTNNGIVASGKITSSSGNGKLVIDGSKLTGYNGSAQKGELDLCGNSGGSVALTTDNSFYVDSAVVRMCTWKNGNVESTMFSATSNGFDFKVGGYDNLLKIASYGVYMYNGTVNLTARFDDSGIYTNTQEHSGYVVTCSAWSDHIHLRYMNGHLYFQHGGITDWIELANYSDVPDEDHIDLNV